MTLAGQFRVAASHPCLAGHFPGRPVVPGVVLLDETFALLLAGAPGLRVAGVPAARFLRPVLPGDEVEVLNDVLQVGGAPGRVAFICRVAGRDAVRGAALLARSDAP